MAPLRSLLGLMGGAGVLFGVALYRLLTLGSCISSGSADFGSGCLHHSAAWGFAIPGALAAFGAGAAVAPFRKQLVSLGAAGFFGAGAGAGIYTALEAGGYGSQTAGWTVGIVFLVLGALPALLALSALRALPSLRSPARSSAGSTLEAVQRLEQLRADGYLTEAEFEAEQARLLAGR